VVLLAAGCAVAIDECDEQSLKATARLTSLASPAGERFFSAEFHFHAGSRDLTANAGGTAVVTLVPRGNRGSCAVTLMLPRP
jgi:hypothetical protein